MSLEQALAAQRESFRETFGCDIGELVHIVCGLQLRECRCDLEGQANWELQARPLSAS